jgi:hypothetical protein
LLGPTGPAGADGAGGGGGAVAAIGAALALMSTTPQASLSGERVMTMDTVTRSDEGFTVNAALGTITVPDDGWYDFSAHVRTSATVTATYTVFIRDGLNNDLVRGDQVTGASIEAGCASTGYLTAGTVIKAFFYSSAASAIVGGAAGAFTYLRVVKFVGGPQGPTGPQGPVGSTTPMTASLTAPANPQVGDVWIKVGSTTATHYAVSASSAGVTPPANVTGAPNGVYATFSGSGAWSTLTATMPVLVPTLIPDWAAINRVFLGVRMMLSSTATTASLNIASSYGDTSVKTLPALTAPNVPEDREVELNAALFTAAMLRATPPAVDLKKVAGSGSVNLSVDSMWMRIEWADQIVGAGAWWAAVGDYPRAGQQIPKNIFWWDGTRWV